LHAVAEVQSARAEKVNMQIADEFDADFPQTGSIVGRSRLRGAGLHPPPLGEPMQSEMFSTEQLICLSLSGGAEKISPARLNHAF
jgi:hypothetical protein